MGLDLNQVCRSVAALITFALRSLPQQTAVLSLVGISSLLNVCAPPRS